MKRFKVLWLLAGLIFAICGKSQAQMAVTLYDSLGRPVVETNGLWVRLSEDMQIDTEIFQAILTQLEKNKYTGNDLSVKFSNTAIGATQSGIWNIGSITTLPAITGTVDVGTVTTLPAVTLSEVTRTETSVLLELTTLDTEYNYTLPANTIYYQAVETTRTVAIRYSDFASGTEVGGIFIPVRAGEYVESIDRAGTKVGSKTLYFRDSVNSGTKIYIRIITL